MGVITISSFYKKPSPDKLKENIKFNKKTYSNQLRELRFLIKTKQADNFTTNMYLALIEGRKITPKMLDAINKIIKSKSPAEVEKKRIEVTRLLGKTRLVSELLSKCDYHHVYVARSENFISSIEESIKKWGNLTKNQKIALNTMYKRFLKKSEKKA